MCHQHEQFLLEMAQDLQPAVRGCICPLSELS